MELAFTIVFVIVVIAAVLGYIANIVKLFSQLDVSGKTIARACGIFIFPLGAILGWF
jgi:hypothetical protein